MHNGLPAALIAMHIPMPTLQGGFAHALFALIKGFLFGFFIALLYDLFASCIARCKSDECVCDRSAPMKK
jgi:hypothetical protein